MIYFGSSKQWCLISLGQTVLWEPNEKQWTLSPNKFTKDVNTKFYCINSESFEPTEVDLSNN